MNYSSETKVNKVLEHPIPILSVIIITYNQERYIHKAIESVLCQKTEFSYELVIGEDFSSDRTRDICIEYQKKYPGKVHLVLSDFNSGGHRIALRTIRHAKGRYIAFCEGDDYWIDDNKLQMQYDFLEKNSEFTGVHTKVNYADENGQSIGTSDLIPSDLNIIDFNYLLQKNVIHTCSFMFRRVVLDETVYSILSASFVQDYALFLATAIKGDIYYINTVTAAYRKNAGVSATWAHMSLLKYRLEIYSLFERHYNMAKYRRAIYATKQYQYFHLFSIKRKGRENISRFWYLVCLSWYSLLSFLFKPAVRVHKVKFLDALNIIYRSLFRRTKR